MSKKYMKFNYESRLIDESLGELAIRAVRLPYDMVKALYESPEDREVGVAFFMMGAITIMSTMGLGYAIDKRVKLDKANEELVRFNIEQQNKHVLEETNHLRHDLEDR